MHEVEELGRDLIQKSKKCVPFCTCCSHAVLVSCFSMSFQKGGSVIRNAEDDEHGALDTSSVALRHTLVCLRLLLLLSPSLKRIQANDSEKIMQRSTRLGRHKVSYGLGLTGDK